MKEGGGLRLAANPPYELALLLEAMLAVPFEEMRVWVI